MLRHFPKALAPFALLLASSVLTARASEPVVRWLITDFPPLFILSGPEREHGLADIAQDIAAQRLTAYRHQRVEVPANYPRIEQEMKSLDNACFAGFLKTPAREKAFVFSQAYRLMLPIHLYVMADREQPPVHDGEVDLQALLASGRFRLGVLGGRKYGTSIDPLLDEHAADRQVYRRYALDQLDGLLGMLAAQSRDIDGVLAYPNEVAHRATASGKAPPNVRRYAIKGTPAYQAGYIACSNSDLGRALVKGIDQLLPEIRPAVARAYSATLQGDDKQRYLDLLQNVFGAAPPTAAPPGVTRGTDPSAAAAGSPVR